MNDTPAQAPSVEAMPSDNMAPPAEEANLEAPSTAPAPPAPSPTQSLPLEKLSPDEWAASKETPAWQLQVARAFHLASTDHALRVPWLPNGQLSEADFDAALHRALHASLR